MLKQVKEETSINIGTGYLGNMKALQTPMSLLKNHFLNAIVPYWMQLAVFPYQMSKGREQKPKLN